MMSGKEKNLILDPMSCFIKLGILAYKLPGTKISITKNKISFHEPNIFQGPIRWSNGDNRNDLHNLHNPLLKATEWYDYNDKMIMEVGGNPETDKLAGFIYIGDKEKEAVERRRPKTENVINFLKE